MASVLRAVKPKAKQDMGGGMGGGGVGIKVNKWQMSSRGEEIHFMHYALSQDSSSTGFLFGPLCIWNNIGSPSHRH